MRVNLRLYCHELRVLLHDLLLLLGSQVHLLLWLHHRIHWLLLCLSRESHLGLLHELLGLLLGDGIHILGLLGHHLMLLLRHHLLWSSLILLRLHRHVERLLQMSLRLYSSYASRPSRIHLLHSATSRHLILLFLRLPSRLISDLSFLLFLVNRDALFDIGLELTALPGWQLI
jgi:hypothetical protein